MPELTAILTATREKDFANHKFLAALQGVNLDDAVQDKTQTTFEDIKARVFSGGQAKNSNDILSLQGINAQQAGFGIGLGLEYQDAKNLENPSW